MSIPIQMPPPSDAPIGWTPNALGPPIASIVNVLQSATGILTPVIPAGARVVILRRRILANPVLDPAFNLVSAAGATAPLGTPPAGAAVIPFMVTSTYSTTSPSGYNTTQSWGIRFAGGTADILTVQGNSALVEERIFAAGLPSGGGVNAGSFLVGNGGNLVIRAGFTNIYLGVAGTDNPNYNDVSVYCLVVTL